MPTMPIQKGGFFGRKVRPGLHSLDRQGHSHKTKDCIPAHVPARSGQRGGLSGTKHLSSLLPVDLSAAHPFRGVHGASRQSARAHRLPSSLYAIFWADGWGGRGGTEAAPAILIARFPGSAWTSPAALSALSCALCVSVGGASDCHVAAPAAFYHVWEPGRQQTWCKNGESVAF